jgi:hypothetical protein
MLKWPKPVVLTACAALVMGVMESRALAQSNNAEQAPRITPGWVLTPTVSMGATHDDNPVLATRGDPSPDDVLTNARPGVDLTFTGKHAFLGTGYRGAIQRYRTLEAYDSYDQGGYFEYRQQASRRISLTARDNFSVSPSTDLLEVGGVPFTRTGTRSNDFNAGLTTAVTKRLHLTGTYHFQWLEFDRLDTPISSLLQGGRSHSVTFGARQSLSSRVKVGGDYTIQRATVGKDLEAEGFTIQNAEGIISYQAMPTVTVEGGAGLSHLELPGEDPRTGPAGHVALRKRTEYALLSVSAMRSFVPAFGFGGSIRNQELLASVRVPFSRNRAFVDAGIAWRNSEPVLQRELGLEAVVVQTSVGYAFQRWLRLEAFYNGATQQSTVVGGRIDRNRIGVQVVTAHPMRLR